MSLATWIIFIVVYAGLGLGYLPKLKLDRAGIALVGSAAILLCGILDLHGAAKAIDYETIVLLFSMMILVSYLQIAGFFEIVADKIAQYCQSPRSFLAAVILSSGVLSAFFVNDVVCVALTPLILHLCERMRKNPIPYLIGLATASNIGSVATITGNPQNVIIGSLSQISYLRFAARLAPIAVIGLLLNYVMVSFVYRRELKEEAPACESRDEASKIQRGLLITSVTVSFAVVLSFFFVKSLAAAAFIGACVMLLNRVKPEKIYRKIDWALLMMFAGLFVVVHAFDVRVVHTWGLESWTFLKDSPVVLVSLLSAVLSNIVSNVPAVLLFKPLIPIITDHEQAWLALSMSSTLAGNLTILGSVANLIVVENCRRVGVNISFFEYLKVGVPLTIISLAVGIGWLQWVHY